MCVRTGHTVPQRVNVSPQIIRTAVALSAKHSVPDLRIRVRGLPCERPPCTLMASGTIKSVVGAKSSEFPFKIIHLGYQSGVAIPSLADQNCDGLSPDHL